MSLRTLEDILTPYTGKKRLLLLDNLNVDLKTFDISLFNNIKDISKSLKIDNVIITGNLFTSLGDDPTFALHREYAATNLKRNIRSDISRYITNRQEDAPWYKQLKSIKERNWELNNLDDKIAYCQWLFRDWNVPEIDYILGGHDQRLIKARIAAEINAIVNKFQQNTLRELETAGGRDDYLLDILKNHPDDVNKILAILNQDLNEGLENQAMDLVSAMRKSHDKKYYGEQPVQKITSKSNLDTHVVHEIIRKGSELYRMDLEKISPEKFFVRGFNWEPVMDNYKFRIMANQTRYKSPRVDGFDKMIDDAKRRLVLDNYLPDIMIQGMHGLMHVRPLRWFEPEDKYTYLLQIPSFEKPEIGAKYDMLTTAGLETPYRHANIFAPLGSVLLIPGDASTPHLFGWLDKKLIENGDWENLEFISKASLSDVHIGHGKTRYDLIEKSFKLIPTLNPDIINIGGDLISGGHYATHGIENILPPPKFTAKNIEEIYNNGGASAVASYLQLANQPLHSQITMMNDMFRGFFGSILRNDGDKMFLINDGHHDRLMMQKEGQIFSAGQMVFDNLVSMIEGAGIFTDGTSERNYDIRADKTYFWNGTTPKGNIDIIFNTNEIRDIELYGHTYGRTHMRHEAKAKGKQSSLINSSKQKCDYYEMEHYHCAELSALASRGGSITNLMCPTFQDITEYGDGTSWSKGAFHTTTIGFPFVYLSKGPTSFKLFQFYLSDIL